MPTKYYLQFDESMNQIETNSERMQSGNKWSIARLSPIEEPNRNILAESRWASIAFDSHGNLRVWNTGVCQMPPLIVSREQYVTSECSTDSVACGEPSPNVASCRCGASCSATWCNIVARNLNQRSSSWSTLA